MMKYFLVDYENVQSTGLNGLELLCDADIHIFFSCPNGNSPEIKISFSQQEQMESKNVSLHFHRTETGSNALDFQLSSYMGYLIGKGFSQKEETTFFIVSKDLGYRCLEKFWCKKQAYPNKIQFKFIRSVGESLVYTANNIQEMNKIKTITKGNTQALFMRLIRTFGESNGKDIFFNLEGKNCAYA